MQGFILSMSKTRTEDMIVRILTPSHIKTLYRFYGARHSIINIGRKIDFEEEAQLGFLPRLRNILHLAHKWELEAQRLYMWQHFIKLLHKHLAEIEEIEGFYFSLLEWGAARLVVQNPKRVSLEMYAKLLQHEGRNALGDLESASGHSALQLKSAMCKCGFVATPLHDKARGVDEPCVLSPCSPCQSPDLSSQILECLGESLPKDSREASEYPFSKSRIADSGLVSESAPHASLESKVDSKVRAERHALSAVKSSFSSEPCSEQALKASPLVSGNLASDCKGEGASLLAVAKPQTHTCTFKPLPLNKKEKKESDEVNQTLEVKVAESSMVGDSEKQALDSKNLESATRFQTTHHDTTTPCFICQEPLDSLVALGRAFLPAHKRCIGGKLYARERIARFLQSASTIWLEDSEVEELWEILSLGL